MRFKGKEEAAAWAQNHESYISYTEERVKRCHGVWYTRRALLPARGQARIVGYGRGNRPVVTCDLLENGAAPEGWHRGVGRVA